MMTIKFEDFLGESKMDATFETDPSKSLILFSDKIRRDWELNRGHRLVGNFQLFYDFYEEEDVDNSLFHGLSLTNKTRGWLKSIKANYLNCRFTQLQSTVYRDTDSAGRKNLTYNQVANIIMNHNNYFFYDPVKGERIDNAAPDREHITYTISAGKKRPWYFIIEKGINCSLVKIKSRQEGGYWAEHQLMKLYNWRQDHHDIDAVIMKNDVVVKANKLISQILRSDDNDVFTIAENENTFVKYDLLIDDERRIEVKKYKNKERDLWNGYNSIPIMLAEQCRMANRSQLVNVVHWFNDNEAVNRRTFNYRESTRLLEIDERLMQREFNMRIKENGHLVENPYRSEIADNIRDAYNIKIEKVQDIFDLPEYRTRWMEDIYGIYFAGDRNNRRNDFLIKINDNGVRNINTEWIMDAKWLGFNQLTMYMEISGDAWEYVLTEGNNFIRTFQLKDFERYERDRDRGILRLQDGVYHFNVDTNYWVKQD
jgi:hypothetical protein